MPTYYVRPDGNDLNVGTAPTNASGTGAFRTVNKALSVAVGGDTVWIAPGTYRENVTTSVAFQAAYINVTGDPTLTQVAWGTGLTAGMVRVTNNLTNDSGTPSGLTLSLVSKRYYRFTNIRFDGSVVINNCREFEFSSCQFYGYTNEFLLTAGENTSGINFNLNVFFDRCVFVDTPIYLPMPYTNSINYANFVFSRCLFFTCANTLRANAFIYASTSNYTWGNVFVSLNCTYVGGTTTPAYIFYNTGGRFGGAPNPFYVFRNNLILTTASVNTWYVEGLNTAASLEENYNAGYSLTRSGVTAGLNDITLKYSGTDNHGAYSSGFATYLMYSPTDDSQLRGAGLAYNQVLFPAVTTPTRDFANNLWKQPNPTIGYLENGNVAPVSGTGGYVPLDRSIQTVTVTAGETGKSVHVYLGSTGVTFQTPNLTCYYARNNGTSVNIPLVAGNASTWVSGSLYEVSAVTMPGVYKFDIPNAVIESGASTASIMLRGANAFNGAFVNINIEQPAQSAYLSTNGYKLLSEYAGSDGVLTVNKRTVTTVKCQITDTNGSAVAVGSSTMTVEVYSGTNVLLASYTPTVQYGGNGQLTFVLDTQITGTAGTYNAYAIRTAATTDRAVFGPLQIKVNEL